MTLYRPITCKVACESLLQNITDEKARKVQVPQRIASKHSNDQSCVHRTTPEQPSLKLCFPVHQSVLLKKATSALAGLLFPCLDYVRLHLMASFIYTTHFDHFYYLYVFFCTVSISFIKFSLACSLVPAGMLQMKHLLYENSERLLF